MKLTDYMNSTGKTAYRIAVDAGLEPCIVTKFIKGERGLSLKSAVLISRVCDGYVAPDEILSESLELKAANDSQ